MSPYYCVRIVGHRDGRVCAHRDVHVLVQRVRGGVVRGLERGRDVLPRCVARPLARELMRLRERVRVCVARAGERARQRQQVALRRVGVALGRAVAVDEVRSPRQRVVDVGREQERRCPAEALAKAGRSSSPATMSPYFGPRISPVFRISVSFLLLTKRRVSVLNVLPKTVSSL